MNPILNPLLHTLDDPGPQVVVVDVPTSKAHRVEVLRVEGFERAIAGVPSSLAMRHLHLTVLCPS